MIFAGLHRALADPMRIPALDLCRGVAILMVVVYHFGYLPFGFLGVDLFFVVSGFVVSRVLFRQVESGDVVRLAPFVVRRAFKIIPSYYAFLLAGGLLSLLLYSQSFPEQVLRLHDLAKYLLFYLNYRDLGAWSFAHLWSISVEEHFYLLLPLVFIFIQRVLGGSLRGTLTVLGLMMLSSVVAKQIGYRVGFETFFATHNRMDALTLGVLIGLLHRRGVIDTLRRGTRRLLLTLGVGLFAGTAYLVIAMPTTPYWNLWVHSLAPLSFGLIIVALLNMRLPQATPIKVAAYYSYNWYLWHVVLVTWFHQYLGTALWVFALYLGVSLGLAVLATIVVEEPALRLRKRFL